MEEGKRFVNPLDPVSGTFWNTVRLDPPDALLHESEALTKMQDVARRTDQVGEIIRSREAFRIANQALDTFAEQMTRYDQLLSTFQGELLGALQDLHPVLERAGRRAGLD